MPHLKHIANLWSLQGHPTLKREWSLETKIKAVAAAGFDGIATALTPAHRRLADKHGLRHLLGYISSNDPDRFRSLLLAQKEGGAVHINVQLDDHDTPPALAAGHWLQMVREAAEIGGLVVSLEVHRDTCTETPEKTHEIAARYHDATGELIKLNFDFSHFAVVKHLAPENYAERLLDHPELLANSEQCHLRPFNGHHCQVPVTHLGRLTPEVKSYLVFVKKLLAIWRRAPGNKDKTLFACPEMGPSMPAGAGYNITGLPPAWPDAIVLRAELAKLWTENTKKRRS
jgi:hypothetical protein